MTALIFQIQIPKRALQCLKCEHILEQGSSYFSLLTEDDESEYLRQDFCHPCFDEMKAGLKGAKYWKSKVPVKKHVPLTHLNKDIRIWDLFKEALQEVSEEAHRIAYVLALYFARKRKIYLRKEIQENGIFFQIYEDADTEEMITVRRMLLSSQDVEETQNIIAKKMKQ